MGKYTLVEIDKILLKKYYDNSNSILYVKLVPYKNNSRIKVYSEENEPIGDIAEEDVDEIMGKNTGIVFLNSELNDDTGLYEIIAKLA